MKQRTNGNNGNGSKAPVHRITRGKIEGAIWRRESRQHGTFYQVSFSRPYQTADGRHGNSESFGQGDLGDVALAAVEAALWMDAQRKPRERSRNGDYSQEGTEPEFSGDADGYDGEQY